MCSAPRDCPVDLSRARLLPALTQRLQGAMYPPSQTCSPRQQWPAEGLAGCPDSLASPFSTGVTAFMPRVCFALLRSPWDGAVSIPPPTVCVHLLP